MPHPRWTQQLRIINDIRNNPRLRAQLLQAADHNPKLANRLALALANNDILNTALQNNKNLHHALRNFRNLLQNNIQKHPEVKLGNDTTEARLFEIMNGGANNLLFNADANTQLQTTEQLNLEMQEEIEKEISEEEEKQSTPFLVEHPELTLTMSATALAIFDERKEVEETARQELEHKGLFKGKDEEYSSQLAEKLMLRPEPTPGNEVINKNEESLAERLNPFKTPTLALKK